MTRFLLNPDQQAMRFEGAAALIFPGERAVLDETVRPRPGAPLSAEELAKAPILVTAGSELDGVSLFAAEPLWIWVYQRLWYRKDAGDPGRAVGPDTRDANVVEKGARFKVHLSARLPAGWERQKPMHAAGVPPTGLSAMSLPWEQLCWECRACGWRVRTLVPKLGAAPDTKTSGEVVWWGSVTEAGERRCGCLACLGVFAR